MRGVCCECQEVHDVRPAHVRREFFDPGWDEVDLSEEDVYVMDYHVPSFGGGSCQGEGTTPQALVEE